MEAMQETYSAENTSLGVCHQNYVKYGLELRKMVADREVEGSYQGTQDRDVG